MMKIGYILSVLLLGVSMIQAQEVWPYHESFETSSGRWSFDLNTSGQRWERNSGPTWYWNTGPSGAHDRDYYCYIDSWNNYWNGDNEYSMSATFDLTALSEPTLTFYYHMFGSGMGMLELQVYTDGDWLTLWFKSGQQNDGNDSPWKKGEVPLESYISANTQIRFKGTMEVNSWISDMAIDDIWIYDKPEELPVSFEWAAIEERQFEDTSFPVQVSAVDYKGDTVTSFSGPVELTAWSAGFGNACQNGDFEAGIHTDWVSYTNEGSSVELLEGVDSAGGDGISLAFEPDDAYGGMSQVVDVSGGERYYVTARFTVENTTDVEIDGQFSGRVLIDGEIKGSTGVWDIYRNSAYSYIIGGYFDVAESEQEGTRTISVVGKSSNNENLGVLLYFDDVSVNFAPEQYLDVAPEISGEFVNGVWSGNVTMNHRLPATHLIARYSDVIGESDTFTTYVSAYDIDFDGMLDNWERLHFPELTIQQCKADTDADGDGYSNGDEFMTGTHPREADSHLAFRSHISGEKCIMDWYAIDSCTYDVEWTSNLKYIPFTMIAEDVPYTQASFTNDLSNVGYYRLKVHQK